MTNSVGILNYGLGNLLSIKYSIEYLKYHCEIIDNLCDIKKFKFIIFPGVGAFDNAIEYIERNLLTDEINQYIGGNKNKLFIGICLGMQIAYKSSEESLNNNNGLNLINGEVKRIQYKYNPPLNGWAKIQLNKSHDLSKKFSFLDNQRVYFTHSYYCETEEENLLATANHQDFRYSAVIKKENFIGLQFHPEKSGKTGLNILQKILSLSEN